MEHLLTLSGLPPDRPASVARSAVEAGEEEVVQERLGDVFREDLQEMRVSWSGVRRVASDQSRWKSLVAQRSSRSGTI